MENEHRAIEERLEKLERQNQRMKLAGLAMLVIAGAAVLIGQAPPNRVLEANEFVLKDPAGTGRARLSMEAADRPTLTFCGENGLIPASLAGGDEPFLVLNRAGSNEQISLGAYKSLYGLALYDKTIRVGLSVQKDAPGLDLFDENGTPRASLASVSITLFRKDKKVLWSAP